MTFIRQIDKTSPDSLPTTLLQLEGFKKCSKHINYMLEKIGRLEPVVAPNDKYSLFLSIEKWRAEPAAVTSTTGFLLKDIVSFIECLNKANRSSWVDKITDHPEFGPTVPLGLSAWKRNGIGYMQWSHRLENGEKDPVMPLMLGPKVLSFLSARDKILQCIECFDVENRTVTVRTKKVWEEGGEEDEKKERIEVDIAIPIDEFMRSVRGNIGGEYSQNSYKGFEVWNELTKEQRCYVLNTWAFKPGKVSPLAIVNFNNLDSTESHSKVQSTLDLEKAAADDWLAAFKSQL